MLTIEHLTKIYPNGKKAVDDLRSPFKPEISMALLAQMGREKQLQLNRSLEFMNLIKERSISVGTRFGRPRWTVKSRWRTSRITPIFMSI